MKPLNQLASLLVVVLVVTAGVGPAVAQSSSGQVVGQPDISIETSAGKLTPGTTVELPLSITNRGQIDRAGPQQYEDRVTTARGLSMSFQDEESPLEVNSGSVAVGNVPTGTRDVSPVEITVPEGLDPGVYELPVEYEYSYTRVAEYGASTEYNDLTRTRTATVEIEVDDKPRFDVVGVDSSAQIGDRNDVAVTLRNTGTETARDASVTAQSKTKELTFGAGPASSTGYVGDWEPGETKTANYSVGLSDDAPHRGYSVDLSVDYTDSNGIDQTSRQLEAGIPTTAEQSFGLENVSSTLRVGEDGSISGTVTNTGPKPVGSAVVQFTDDDSPNVIPIERSVAVGSLKPGESKSFRLPIEVSSEAEAGAKLLDFAVRYRNSEAEIRQYTKLDVTADIAPERDQFDVDIQESTITAGGEQAITVSVTNELNQTVTDVEARIFADDPLDTGDDDTGYVESLEPGESVTMTFELSASESATEKTYPVSFDFRYDDERNKSQLSNTIRVPMSVTTDDGGFPLSLVLITGSLLIGAVGVFWYRRD
ncbi:putative exo-alpha-sialidase [Natrinema pellirubrum DSM 15624]|uniref:Alpha-galactosidase family protein n=1 Tax=Natrinema pellirubrum (strain DSM 15624 / CIP 106293 / JCM 10476 / NCIMB 786 / 157) TaxID=797303 RepID=L0JJT3_NATP1|nr:COG1361 S-layer family protein [Natrinema pellirubrum]AGB31103.1 alpha-galactosidase family protein [Natrinema pellirubrum DSM 15624]ELY81245.1 putative exo-alpha-sialidase [Natrinema pellirubrum DSM 15624]